MNILDKGKSFWKEANKASLSNQLQGSIAAGIGGGIGSSMFSDDTSSLGAIAGAAAGASAYYGGKYLVSKYKFGKMTRTEPPLSIGQYTGDSQHYLPKEPTAPIAPISNIDKRIQEFKNAKDIVDVY